MLSLCHELLTTQTGSTQQEADLSPLPLLANSSPPNEQRQNDQKTIIFDVAKKESHNPNNGFKKLFRRLRAHYKISSNKDDLTSETLAEADLLVFGGPREAFTEQECADLKAWLDGGGRMLFLVADPDKSSSCNHADLFSDMGVTVNDDSVMRQVYYKYLHPKEVFIAEGVLIPDMARKKNSVSLGSRKPAKEKESKLKSRDAAVEKLPFVYPYGCTLNVAKPSRCMLSSGPVSFPMNRPVASIWEAETVQAAGGQRGRLALLGSVDIFGDDWLDKEENSKLSDMIFAWLLGETDFDMAAGRQDAEIAEYAPVPHIESLSQSIKPCLQGMDELPRDFTKMFDTGLFRFDTDLIPQTLQLYETLGVPHETLTLIPPQFEAPLPKLLPATFPPAMREPAPPALDQFDLDEHFAKEGRRLAQLTNKCADGVEDLEYYVAESGEILGVMGQLPFGARSAKHILFHIFKQIVDFKKRDGGKSSEPLVDYGHDGGAFAPAFEYDGEGGTEVDAMPVPIHIARVDLAPMRLDATSAKLSALDPALGFGGPAIGENKNPNAATYTDSKADFK